MPWDPEVYNEFKKERNAPFFDLVALVDPRRGMRVVDLGCGTGELTAQLPEYFPEASVVGIDSSKEMLSQADLGGKTAVELFHRTIQEQFQLPDKWDLVFSNAALQWVPDHSNLFGMMIPMLLPAGQLAVQVPSNHDHYSHRFLRQLAGDPSFQKFFSSGQASKDKLVEKEVAKMNAVLPISQYASLLYSHGARKITVIEKVYPHVLPDADAMFQWVSGTALIPFLERLPDPVGQEFKERYKNGLRAYFPGSPVFFSFNRILLHATF